MNSNRLPKGIPAGGQFAALQRPEPRIFIGGTQQMKPIEGELARSADQDISGQEARRLWDLAKGRIDTHSGTYEQLAHDAGQNLAQNRATPPDVLHDMVVKRGKDGVQITHAWFMDRHEMRVPLQAVLNNTNTSAETLHVIARSSGHEPQSDAAKRRLKEMRRGASLGERYRLFTERRKATRKGTPGK